MSVSFVGLLWAYKFWVVKAQELYYIGIITYKRCMLMSNEIILEEKANTNFNPRLYGFGGIMYLLLIQMLFNAYTHFRNIEASFLVITNNDYFEISMQNPLYTQYVWLSLFMSGITLLLMGWIAWSGIKQRKSFVKLSIIYQIVISVIALINFYYLVSLNVAAQAYQLPIAIGFSIFWIVYLKRSVRVKQTFYK